MKNLNLDLHNRIKKQNNIVNKIGLTEKLLNNNYNITSIIKIIIKLNCYDIKLEKTFVFKNFDLITKKIQLIKKLSLLLKISKIDISYNEYLFNCIEKINNDKKININCI